MEEQYPEGEVNPGILVYIPITSKPVYYKSQKWIIFWQLLIDFSNI